MAGISSKSAPPTSKSKSTNGKKPQTGQNPDGVRQDTPQRDPNDDSYSAGALYSPYPSVEKQNAVKQAAKSGLFGKPQQGLLKTPPAGSATPTQQNGMPPTAPPLGSTSAPVQQVGLPQTTPSAGSAGQQKTGTPQSPAQTGSNAPTQPQGITPDTPVAGATTAVKAPGATTPAKGAATTKSASKKEPATKMQATSTQKTMPSGATTPDVSKAGTPSQPTATVPPGGSPTTSPPPGTQPYAGQPYPPQYQQYQPQAYPGQYPYNPQYRPQYQPYPYQTQPGYPGYPQGTPYQTGYPSAYPGSPAAAPTTQQPGYPATAPTTQYPATNPSIQQPTYPPGAAEPFSTMKRPAPAQAAPQNYSAYPTQQPQYPAQQAYPPQWQQRPYYPPQQYPGQQYPGQQYYQQPPPQNYPLAQPPQNAAPMQQQQAPQAPAAQSQTVQQAPAEPQQTQQQPPASQPPASAQSNPPEKGPASAAPEDKPQTASNGGSSAASGDNMTEFLAKVTAARQMISTGNPAFAVDSLDQAVKLRPRNLSVYFYRGLAYDESGDPSTAVKNYLESVDRAKTVGMDSAELRTNLGNSYMKLNFFDDAIVEYQKAIEIEPASGTAHMQLGRALLSKGDYPAALKSLRKCETLGINDPTVSYLKALCFAAMKQKQEALTELAPLLTPASASKNPQLNKLAEDLKGDLK